MGKLGIRNGGIGNYGIEDYEIKNGETGNYRIELKIGKLKMTGRILGLKSDAY
ncbi:hypothetical protein [Fodinibius roseus]|uniref:hypothetical protein n=1 Tax=Fodinibius roseus TaxID=1194090 RepID=UPI00147DF7A9|nr:hypothetical protein [Fodinibius roseus]